MMIPIWSIVFAIFYISGILVGTIVSDGKNDNRLEKILFIIVAFALTIPISIVVCLFLGYPQTLIFMGV